jgi:hypothetical protein
MKRLVDFLAQGCQEGYPTDYLLARLQARTRTFTARCPVGRGEEAWLAWQDEYGWLFRQMNINLRSSLAPIFFYFELRNLFAALRFGAGGDRDGLKYTLAGSLLGPQLQSILMKDQAFPAILKELDDLLGDFGDGANNLSEVWRLKGFGSLEFALLSIFIRASKREQPPQAVRDFLNRILDRRNLLQLAKAQRWHLAESLLTAKDPTQLRHQRQRYLEQLRRRDPEVVDDPARLDTLLLMTLLRDCRRSARTAQPLPMILAYLYSCWLTARDCGVRGLTPLLGENRIATELVG